MCLDISFVCVCVCYSEMPLRFLQPLGMWGGRTCLFYNSTVTASGV